MEVKQAEEEETQCTITVCCMQIYPQCVFIHVPERGDIGAIHNVDTSCFPFTQGESEASH